MGTGRASGKLIFFGEHAVVHGHPALGSALPWKITAEHQHNDEESWEFPGLPSEYRTPLLEALKALEDLVGHRLPRGVLRIKSEVPVGSGFGSSGALCGALVQTFSPGSFQESWKMAHSLEKAFHGKPSGLDTALALRDGLLSFRPQTTGLPAIEACPGFDLHLVAGGLPRSGNTRQLVLGLKDRVSAGEAPVLDAFQTLGDLAEKAIHSLKSRTAAGELWGTWATQAQAVLAGLGLSTPLLDRVLDQGRIEGALGGKLSGAGGGGAFFLIFPDGKSALSAKNALRAWGDGENIPWTCAPEAFRWDPERNRLVLSQSAFDSLFKD